MVIVWAVGGMVICGCSRLPFAGHKAAGGVELKRTVARVGQVSVWLRIWKKPFPWITRSSGLLVW